MADGSSDRWHYYADRQKFHGISRDAAAALQSLQTENRALQEEIRRLQGERDYYQASFDAIRTARWWTITAPLRKMVERFRKLRSPSVQPAEPSYHWTKPEVSPEETSKWAERHAASSAVFGIEAAERSEALLRSLQNQSYASWQWGSEGSDFTLLLTADCALHPYALSMLAEALERHDLVYCDEWVKSGKGNEEESALCRFAFSPYSLRSSCDLGTVVAVRTSLFSALPDGANNTERLLMLCDMASSVQHIPALLCRKAGAYTPTASEEGCIALEKHLRRHGLTGSVAPTEDGHYYHITYDIPREPLVSVVIPNWEHIVDISVCLESLFSRSSYRNIEVIVVRNGSESDEISAFYAEAERQWEKLRVVSYAGEFNYSAICNFGVQAAAGEYILLLNNDIEVITPNWIEEMLMLAQQKDVGVVGAKLLYPNETVQHCGMAFTSPISIEHMFRGESALESGPLGFLSTVQEVTAVTGACILLRSELFHALGGLDERLAVSFSDVDLCMKTRRAGYRVLVTPFACLYHMEGSTRGTELTGKDAEQFLEEAARFFARWGEWSEKGDLFVNA